MLTMAALSIPLHNFARHYWIFFSWYDRPQWARPRLPDHRVFTITFTHTHTNTHTYTNTHTHTHHSVRLLWTSDQPDAETFTWQGTTLTKDKHPWIRRGSNPQSQQESGLRPRGQWDRQGFEYAKGKTEKLTQTPLMSKCHEGLYSFCDDMHVMQQLHTCGLSNCRIPTRVSVDSCWPDTTRYRDSPLR